jgi:hypothetical protein
MGYVQPFDSDQNDYFSPMMMSQHWGADLLPLLGTLANVGSNRGADTKCCLPIVIYSDYCNS